MPSSAVEGREWVRYKLADLVFDTVVDVGPGEGTYVDLLRSAFPKAKFIAVEIWEPYISRFGLREKYDAVVVGDAAYVDSDIYRGAVVIAGDVCEHMEEEQLNDFLHSVSVGASVFVASVPIIHYPQGEEEGNPYEAHRLHFTQASFFAKLMQYFYGWHLYEWYGQVVGRWILIRP